MAKKKYRLTGCAKFFFVLIILLPIAFIAASYFNGVDPFAAIKDAWQSEMGKQKTEKVSTSNKSNSANDETLDLMKQDLDHYKSEVERLKRELNACQTARN